MNLVYAFGAGAVLASIAAYVFHRAIVNDLTKLHTAAHATAASALATANSAIRAVETSVAAVLAKLEAAIGKTSSKAKK